MSAAEPLRYRADLNAVTASDSSPWVDIERGEFCYELGEDGQPDRIAFWARQCKWPVCLPINGRVLTRGASWGFTGPLESPTLSPSVWINKGYPDDWHGWLRGGIASDA